MLYENKKSLDKLRFVTACRNLEKESTKYRLVQYLIFWYR